MSRDLCIRMANNRERRRLRHPQSIQNPLFHSGFPRNATTVYMDLTYMVLPVSMNFSAVCLIQLFLCR
ncbi:hypothetical protein H5410_044367 [Solanum commersonii]|uniref:Uncharacterized protein n=1 Tax=Solanum commersonii TaxID=4109 RepID=A0A9J5X8V4_SOLCO|nr:hypothetical protein H5410_044367 [Solanum commersonii]